MKKLILIFLSTLLLLLSVSVQAAPDIDDITMEMMDLDDRSLDSVTQTIEIPLHDDRAGHNRHHESANGRDDDIDDDRNDDDDDKDDDRDDDKDDDDSDDSIDDDGINDSDND